MSNLHELARTGRAAETRALLSAGANIDEQDRFRATPLHYAIAHHHLALALELIKLGADASVQDEKGATALHYAAEYGPCEVLEAILVADAKAVNIQDSHGNQPLWTAAFRARGQYESVQALLRHGADPRHRNKAGLCPLDMPERLGDQELLKVLQGAT